MCTCRIASLLFGYVFFGTDAGRRFALFLNESAAGFWVLPAALDSGSMGLGYVIAFASGLEPVDPIRCSTRIVACAIGHVAVVSM